jgi:4-hydroxy-tetrahydrodipicolinate synthase
MSRNKPISGVTCAALLPRDPEGRPLWEIFEASLGFLKASGVDGICVNGATGEYAGATAQERRQAVAMARRIMGTSGLVISGAGGASFAETLDRARDAEAEGADVHLVPAPFFFPYSQDDLGEFFRLTAAAVQRPVLIYNLPSFTSGVDKPLALELIRGEENIAGMKDSSGRVDILEALTTGGPADAVRFVGNDSVLAQCLENQWCTGAISGVACVLPELILALWHNASNPGGEPFQHARRLLAEFIEQLGPWPVPWGLKLVAEARNLGPASTALPLSAARRQQAKGFHEWFEPWWANARTVLEPATHKV